MHACVSARRSNPSSENYTIRREITTTTSNWSVNHRPASQRAVRATLLLVSLFSCLDNNSIGFNKDNLELKRICGVVCYLTLLIVQWEHVVLKFCILIKWCMRASVYLCPVYFRIAILVFWYKTNNYNLK